MLSNKLDSAVLPSLTALQQCNSLCCSMLQFQCYNCNALHNLHTSSWETDMQLCAHSSSPLSLSVAWESHSAVNYIEHKIPSKTYYAVSHEKCAMLTHNRHYCTDCTRDAVKKAYCALPQTPDTIKTLACNVLKFCTWLHDDGHEWWWWSLWWWWCNLYYHDRI